MKFFNKISQTIKKAVEKVKKAFTPKGKAESQYEAAREKINRKMEVELGKATKAEKDFIGKTGISTKEQIPARALGKEELLKRTAKMQELMNQDDILTSKINKKIEVFLDNLLSGMEDDAQFADFANEFKKADMDIQIQFMEQHQEELKAQYEDYKDGFVDEYDMAEKANQFKQSLRALDK